MFAACCACILSVTHSCLYCIVLYSYSIIKECWNDDSESRPTFLELKKDLDNLISHEERYNYLPLGSRPVEEGCEVGNDTEEVMDINVFPTPQLIEWSEYRTTMESDIPSIESTEYSDSGQDVEVSFAESAH